MFKGVKIFIQCLEVNITIFKKILNSNDVILIKLANFITYIVDTYAGINRVYLENKNESIKNNNNNILKYGMKLLITSLIETGINTYFNSSCNWKIAINRYWTKSF